MPAIAEPTHSSWLMTGDGDGWSNGDNDVECDVVACVGSAGSGNTGRNFFREECGE